MRPIAYPDYRLITLPRVGGTVVCARCGRKEQSEKYLVRRPPKYCSTCTPKGRAFEDRLSDLVMTEPNSGCWLFIGCTNSRGYGQIAVDGRPMYAYKAAYLHYIGPIPSGLELDHLCRVRACVNPWHLEPVTHAVNVLRGSSPAARHAKQTSCKAGHEFSAENTNRRLSPNGRVWRDCLTCRRTREMSRQPRRRPRP